MNMKITYHGHSCVQITHEGQSLIIDPFLTGNSLAVVKPEEIHVQYILLTHAHSDHIGDTIALAKQCGATVIAIHELATYLSWQGLNTHGMNIGGSFSFGWFTAKMTQAFHSSGLVLDEEQRIVYAGMPAGFLVTVGDKTMYHVGDTGLFSDLKMIGERNKIDVAFVPMGDNYTMGPEDALQASEWIGAGLTIPVHYDTFPVIQQNVEMFVNRLEEKQMRGRVVKPGETFEI